MFFTQKQLKAKEYSPLALAYIGDSVYDLYIRTRVLEKGNRHVTDMHKNAVRFVKANAQARSTHAIEEILTEDEMRVLNGAGMQKATRHQKTQILRITVLRRGLKRFWDIYILRARRSGSPILWKRHTLQLKMNRTI